MKNLIACVLLFAALSILTGVVYPAAVTAVSLGLFPEKARGSLVRINNETTGSRLIGQKFSSPGYFWTRPSASDYGALPSSASNLGPTSAALKQQVEDRRKNLAPYFQGAAPADLLLASGSGLDPEVSPEDALAQVEHVAKARGLSASEKERLIGLVKDQSQGPQWHVFGNPRVNVLELNIGLDRMFPPERPRGR
jgi:potassium-transporting ATPase KdpC subunit